MKGPYEQLLEFNRNFPDTKVTYKAMQRWQVANQPDDGVFCPSSQLWEYNPTLLQAITSRSQLAYRDKTLTDKGRKMMQLFWGVHLFGTWRNSLGIYKIDADMFEQTVRSPIPNDTPSNIFKRLPEWCVYIEFPEGFEIIAEDKASRAKGFWALLDYSSSTDDEELTLNIVPDLLQEMGGDCAVKLPMQIIINDGLTVEQSHQKLIKETQSKLKEAGYQSSRDDNHTEIEYRVITSFLSLLLWLCVDEPDISNIHGEPISSEELRKPKFSRNKKTGTFIPPNQPCIYNIGERLGGEVRDFKERKAKSEISRVSSRKRPHIRQGHWHGVWSGTGQNKKFGVYWQPAIFVNAKVG